MDSVTATPLPVAGPAPAPLGALARATTEYDEKRWNPGSPKKRGDALCDAALGYLDVRTARTSLGA